jgi:hypothetical protein
MKAQPIGLALYRGSNLKNVKHRLIFDRQAEGRAKTGRAAIGTISQRTERLVGAYFSSLATERHPDAVLFRNRSGGSYRDDTLGDDFASVRELAFPGDKRRLMA